MTNDVPPDEVVWRPGNLDRARSLARRLLKITLGPAGEAVAHSVYHRFLRRVGRFGPPEDTASVAALQAVASRSRTIIDVGANVGRYSWFFRRHARSDTTLFALEPHPASADLLRGAIGLEPGSTVLEIGAGDTDGFARLVVPTGAFGSSVAGLAWVERGPGTDRGIRILVRRLDGLVEDGTMPVLGPVFLKIDVEGGEAGVLRGAARLMDQYRPVIYLECQASLLARHGETPARVWDVLREAGYRCLAVRAGVLVPLGRAEPHIVNYLCIPDIDVDDETGRIDLGALEAVLDAWASQTQTR